MLAGLTVNQEGHITREELDLHRGYKECGSLCNAHWDTCLALNGCKALHKAFGCAEQPPHFRDKLASIGQEVDETIDLSDKVSLAATLKKMMSNRGTRNRLIKLLTKVASTRPTNANQNNKNQPT